MMIFLILAPYGAFATLMLFASAATSLFVSAAICLGVVALDVFKGRSIKMLGAGSAILFAALGCYITLVDTGVSSTASETGGRCRRAGDLARLASDPPAVHAAICPRSGRCRDGAIARLPARQLSSSPGRGPPLSC